jgi:hypothetical protein
MQIRYRPDRLLIKSNDGKTRRLNSQDRWSKHRLGVLLKARPKRRVLYGDERSLMLHFGIRDYYENQKYFELPI